MLLHFSAGSRIKKLWGESYGEKDREDNVVV